MFKRTVTMMLAAGTLVLVRIPTHGDRSITFMPITQ